MKTIIVTGAAGFLGSHIARRHLDMGDQVLGVDDFSSSARGSLHLKDLQKHSGFTFLEGNIIHEATLSKMTHGWIWGNGGLNRIYNFACPASPPVYQAKPIHTMLTCVVGLDNVLKLARSTSARVVHASTSEVYGDPVSSPQSESYRGNVNSYGPRACYDEGKRAAEALCYDYLNSFSTDVRMVRIFNTYGPHMDPCDGRVVSNFIVQALKRQRLTIYGDGMQTRSFCYVDDLVDGIVAMGDLNENPRKPVNLGNPYEFTVKELAQRVIHEVLYSDRPVTSAWPRDVSALIDSRPLPVDDPLQRRPDITAAKALLGWEPKVQLQSGLTKTIEYFRSQV